MEIILESCPRPITLDLTWLSGDPIGTIIADAGWTVDQVLNAIFTEYKLMAWRFTLLHEQTNLTTAVDRFLGDVLPEPLDRCAITVLRRADNEKQKDTQAVRSAAVNGRLNILCAALDSGVLVNCDLGVGKTPLHLAAANGHKECLDALLARGAQVNIERDHWGSRSLSASCPFRSSTPLHEAAKVGHKECLDALLVWGALVNAKDYRGWTPLLHAAKTGNKECLDALLAQRAEVNARNDERETPLIWATRAGHKQCADALLAQGAQVNMKDESGHTALCFCKTIELRDLLQAAGARLRT